MNPIEKRIRYLEAVLASINQIIRATAEQNSELFEELNRKQLLQGKKSDGSDMPTYVPGSNQPSAPGKITLFDTGALQEGIQLFTDEERYFLESTDEKNNLMIWAYGDFIYGLGEESQKIVKEKMLPEIAQKLKQLRAQYNF